MFPVRIRSYRIPRTWLLSALSVLLLASVAFVAGRSGPEPRTYAFRVLYAVLHDDEHGPLPEEAQYGRRLRRLARVMERESFGRIRVTTRLHFIHARELGDERIDYSNRSAPEWISLLEGYCAERGIPYDILIFLPATAQYGPWCTDGPSLGYSHEGRKYLCLETFLDPARASEDARAVALAIHKILHGFGYNHVSQENRPSNLLEWNLGLPKTRILPLAPTGGEAPLLFDRHMMKVLGFLPRNEFEEECPDAQGLLCLEEDSFLCANSYDIGCTDADRDGRVDRFDDYPFTPYGRADAPDSDADGIPDALDLCEGNRILFQADIPVGKGKAWVNRDRVEIRIEPAPRIQGVNLYEARNLGGFIAFPKRASRRFTGNRLRLEAKSLSAVTRLQVFYRSAEGVFYRPFYLYREPQRFEYVHEKEWYYFSRFGCDVPLGVRFDDPSTYDRDLDGLPDRERFSFAGRIREDYDWDGDGVPDRRDSLPTVHGDCSNRSVRGVPDSDGDGLCDPARFRFARNPPGSQEADLAITFLDDQEADRCPYVAGRNPDGCP